MTNTIATITSGYQARPSGFALKTLSVRERYYIRLDQAVAGTLTDHQVVNLCCEINNRLHRKAEAIAPRFADECADSGCTNIRPGADEPRRRQAWDMCAEALTWNMLCDLEHAAEARLVLHLLVAGHQVMIERETTWEGNRPTDFILVYVKQDGSWVCRNVKLTATLPAEAHDEANRLLGQVDFNEDDEPVIKAPVVDAKDWAPGQVAYSDQGPSIPEAPVSPSEDTQPIIRLTPIRNAYNDGWETTVDLCSYGKHQGHVCTFRLGKADRESAWFSYALPTVISASPIPADRPTLLAFEGQLLDIGGTLYTWSDAIHLHDPRPVLLVKGTMLTP
jgi:hypothetical protein